jgi:hypothetical protein
MVGCGEKPKPPETDEPIAPPSPVPMTTPEPRAKSDVPVITGDAYYVDYGPLH